MGMKQVPKYDIKWLLIIALIVMLGASWNSEARDYPYDFPVQYDSFHMVTGNTHSVYECSGIERCYEVWETAQLNREIQCSDRFWIERADGTVQILK